MDEDFDLESLATVEQKSALVYYQPRHFLSRSSGSMIQVTRMASLMATFTDPSKVDR